MRLAPREVHRPPRSSRSPSRFARAGRRAAFAASFGAFVAIVGTEGTARADLNDRLAETVGVVLLTGLVVSGAIVSAAYFDADAGSSKSRLPSGAAAVEAIGFDAAAAASGILIARPSSSGGDAAIGVFGMGLVAPLGGFATASLASDGPTWWGFGLATGFTAAATTHAVRTLVGLPSSGAGSVLQSMLATTGGVLGALQATRSNATRAEETSGVVLAAVSAAVLVHGVLDVALPEGSIVKNPRRAGARVTVLPVGAAGRAGLSLVGSF